MDKIRLFVAVTIPANVRSRLADVGRQLKASGADAKWVREENLHVTLKFLGYVDPGRLDKISVALRNSTRGVTPFGVKLSGVGAFPNPGRPSVVWVGISAGCEEMKALAERVDTAMGHIGFAREAREFSPHVTVGRVQSRSHVYGLPKAVERLSKEYIGSFGVDGVVLMRSDLRPTGPVYSEVAGYVLSGPGRDPGLSEQIED